MGIPLTLNNVTNFNNQTTAANTINNNSQTIVTAFASALDTQGDQMEGQLDMNSNHIVNLPTPASMQEPMRIIDFVTLASGGTVTVTGIPAGGSTGYVLTKNSPTNYDTVWSPIPGVNNGVTNAVAFYTTASSVGAAVDVSISGGTLRVGSTSAPGVLSLVGNSGGTYNISVATSASGALVLPNGSTNFTVTGGTNQVLMQSASGAAITVGTLSAANLVNGTTGTGAIVLSSSPTFTGNGFIQFNQLVSDTMGQTLVGNPTAGTAGVAPFQLTSLPSKAGPTGTDIMLISDQAASGQLKQATISNIVAAQTAGVASINGEAGSLTLSANDGDVVTTSGTAISFGGPGGFRNKIINGTFDVWQRGTTISIASTSGYAADRWLVTSLSGTTTVTQQSGRSSGNSVFSMQLAGASSVNINTSFQQRVESYAAVPLGNTVATFQAWIFNNTTSTVTPTISFNVPTAQDNYTSVSTYSSTSLQPCTASAWTQVAIAITTPNTINGIAAVVSVSSAMNASTKSMQVAEVDFRATPGVAVGLTSTPPPVEFRPVAAELPMCQRYFSSNFPIGTAPANSTANATYNFMATSASVEQGIVSYPISMRSTPTLTYFSPNTASASSANWKQLFGASGTNFTPSTITNNTNYFVTSWTVGSGLSNGQGNAVQGGWSATAEL